MINTTFVGRVFLRPERITDSNIDDVVALADTIGTPYPLVYDHVIRCLGWKHNTSVYAPEVTPILQKNLKYAVMTEEYESVNVPGLFFAGEPRLFSFFAARLSSFSSSFSSSSSSLL